MRKYLPSTYSSTLKTPLAGKSPSPSYNSINDQNSIIESIRQKYSCSKEKNLFTLRRDDSVQNYKPKEPLKEAILNHTRSNTSISVNQVRQRECNRDGRTIHREMARHINRSISRERIDEILNRSGPVEHVEKERQEKSKEKMFERLDNINKIRDKISSLMSKYEIGNTKAVVVNDPAPIDLNSSLTRKGVIKRNNFGNERDVLNSSLTDSSKRFNFASEYQYRSRDSRSSSSSNLHSQSIFIQRPSLKIHNITLQKEDYSRLEELPLEKYSSTQPSTMPYKHHKYSQSAYFKNPQPKTNYVQLLVSALCTQIQYDQEFRTAKYLFHLLQNKAKYHLLSQAFEQKGIQYFPSKLQQQMRFHQDQSDPFMEQNPHQDYQRYADALLASSHNWRQNIFKKFNYRKLIDNGINETLRSENRKVQVADLARFINLNSNKLYKNRDLTVIMRRISDRKDIVELPDVWRVLCGDYE